MIRIRIHSDASCFRLEANGHAQYDEKGKDIVCAAVSAVTHTMCVYAIESEHTGGHTISGDGNGWIYLECHADDYAKEALNAMVRGLEEISENYPDHVTVMQD